MIPWAWNWLRKNVILVLLVASSACLAFALGEVIRGATWTLLMPVSLAAVVCGWALGSSRLKPKQAWVGLIGLGIPVVFIYVGGLFRPIVRLILAVLSLFPQTILWVSDQVPIDTGLMGVTWNDLVRHAASLLIRLWEWWMALFFDRPFVDPLVAGLVWSMLLWLVGVWTGWQLRRHHQALHALAPGCVALALVLDYSRGETGLLIVYLAILLTLMGLTRVNWMLHRWEQLQVDYSESIRIDTLATVGVVTVALVLSAAGAPSISWREIVERLRGTDSSAEDQAAEALGLGPLTNVANSGAYHFDGLPRSHLINSSPELLQDVVMTISTGELPPVPETVTDISPKRYYWRAIVYDVYSGAGWSSSRASEIPLPSDTPLIALPPAYRIVNQHVTRTQNLGSSLYWTGILAQADTELEIAWRTKPPNNPDSIQSGDMLGALTDSDEYTAVSYIPQFSADQLRDSSNDYPPEIAERYLQLPDSTPERVLALARELTQASQTPYDRAVAIESYLRTFPYTLDVDPPPRNRDVADYFLFTAKQGYCDYYATSMIVLARASGLPARLVIGYASGDYNPQTAEYIVRQEHAHSWVDVYFSGLGWVEFEPTAAQPAIDRVDGESAAGTPPNLPAGLSTFSWLKTQWRNLISSLGGQFVIAGLGLILLLALWQVVEISYLRLLPYPKVMQHIYQQLEKYTLRMMPNLPVGHTPYQLQSTLAHLLGKTENRVLKAVFSPVDREIERLVVIYIAQVYSDNPPTKSQINQGIRTWTRLRWRLRLAIGIDRLNAARRV